MTEQAIEALHREREELLGVLHSLSDSEWSAPSACPGWRVHDVVAHLATTYRMIVDPSSIPTGGGDDFEADAEIPVAERKAWPHAEVLAEYDEWSTKGIATLALLQQPPAADAVIPLGNLGSHPMHLLADAMAFDHYCHLRNDILRPRGPLDRPAPPDDDLHLAPTVTWLMAGLPQQCAGLLEVLDGPVVLDLAGPGGGQWTLTRLDGSLAAVPGAAAGASVTVTSTAADFVLWGTKRTDWREHGVSITGDADYAALVLDAVDVI